MGSRGTMISLDFRVDVAACSDVFERLTRDFCFASVTPYMYIVPLRDEGGEGCRHYNIPKLIR